MKIWFKSTPEGEYCRIRFSPASATATLPCESTAKPEFEFKPEAKTALSKAPLAPNLETVPKLLLLTNRFPWPSKAKAWGRPKLLEIKVLTTPAGVILAMVLELFPPVALLAT